MTPVVFDYPYEQAVPRWGGRYCFDIAFRHVVSFGLAGVCNEMVTLLHGRDGVRHSASL